MDGKSDVDSIVVGTLKVSGRRRSDNNGVVDVREDVNCEAVGTVKESG